MRQAATQLADMETERQSKTRIGEKCNWRKKKKGKWEMRWVKKF